MSFAADISTATLTVCLDVRHPFCYLALGPAAQFARARAIEINWLPLVTPTLKAPSVPGPDDDRGILHRRYRAEALAREIETYASAGGLTIEDYYRSEPADAATRGWLWVRHRANDRLERFLDSLFRGYWTQRLDADSDQEIADLIDSVGGDGASFLAWSGVNGAAVAKALADELTDYGLFTVPAYVVEDEVFYGRQHLPMIAWILDGRTGPVPI